MQDSSALPFDFDSNVTMGSSSLDDAAAFDATHAQMNSTIAALETKLEQEKTARAALEARAIARKRRKLPIHMKLEKSHAAVEALRKAYDGAIAKLKNADRTIARMGAMESRLYAVMERAKQDAAEAAQEKRALQERAAALEQTSLDAAAWSHDMEKERALRFRSEAAVERMTRRFEEQKAECEQLRRVLAETRAPTADL